MSLEPAIVEDGYDRVAQAYAEQFGHELDHKPFDRVMLSWLVERAGRGVICDLGCGPGHVSAHLAGLGAETIGIDLSPQMVAVASSMHPALRFEMGDMTELSGIDDGSFAGVAALYSIIHQPHDRVVVALREMVRVLRPGGVLLVSFHVGTEVRHLDAFLGAAVDLDFVFFTSAQMRGWMIEAGLIVTEAIERDPYPEEVATRRAYMWART